MKKQAITFFATLPLLLAGCMAAHAQSDNRSALVYDAKSNSLYQMQNEQKQTQFGLFKGQQIRVPNKLENGTLTGKLVVTLQDGYQEQALLTDSRLSIQQKHAGGIYILATDEGSDLQQLIWILRANPAVKSVRPEMAIRRARPL